MHTVIRTHAQWPGPCHDASTPPQAPGSRSISTCYLQPAAGSGTARVDHHSTRTRLLEHQSPASLVIFFMVSKRPSPLLGRWLHATSVACVSRPPALFKQQIYSLCSSSALRFTTLLMATSRARVFEPSLDGVVFKSKELEVCHNL